ncbi:MAG: hypothetical protein IJP33_00810, partial [Firmicutes bacterium]|nr:hypothetical protein [Bacillota bacterium]
MATQFGGYWNKMIKVDMTTGKIDITDEHMQYVEEYLGGRALGIKMLWEALKDNPGADPLGPENPLIIIPGPEAGVGIPCSASRVEIVCKSALTQAKNSPFGENGNTVAYSSGGGKFAPTVKWAGYDLIYVTGNSDTPKVLYIDNDEVKLIDGSKYWGMETTEFEEAIQTEFGPEWKNTCVGPAGENLVRIACIMNEAGRSCSRSGVGAVMGSKKLKGIVVRGNKPVPIANPAGLREQIDSAVNKMQAVPGVWSRRRFGTAGLLTSMDGMLDVKNWSRGKNPHDDKIGSAACVNNFWVRHRSCWACPVYCMKAGVVREGKYKGVYTEGPELETGVLGSGLLMETMGDFAHLMDIAERDGIDQLSMGGILGLACECYEKGIIKASDIDGIKLEWGNSEEIGKFMKNVIYKQKDNKIYAWFAKGPGYAAKQLGAEAEKIAPHVKNQSYNVMLPQMMVNTFAFSTRGACHLYGASATAMDGNVIRDLGGFCNAPTNNAFGTQGICDMNNFVMGISLTRDQYLYVGEKCSNIERMFNCLNGFSKDDD